MRTDYNYVDVATSLCITTTEFGHQYASTMADEDFEKKPDGTIFPLLALLEDAHVIVPSRASLDRWQVAINQAAFDYGDTLGFSKEIILEAFKLGYIGIEKVIWDESRS